MKIADLWLLDTSKMWIPPTQGAKDSTFLWDATSDDPADTWIIIHR